MWTLRSAKMYIKNKDWKKVKGDKVEIKKSEWQNC